MKDLLYENEKNEIESFVRFVVSTYFGKKRNLSTGLLAQIYEQFDRLIELDSIKDKRYKEKAREVLDRFYKIICKPDVFEKLKYSQITKKDFLDLYMEEISGFPKRKYEMRDLYREDMISRTSKTSQDKKVKFTLKQSKFEHQYYDKLGRLVILSIIGNLAYEEWNGLNSSLTAYKVKRENDDGSFSEYTVFSNIIIPEMENEDYKDAVLNELLSEKNITLSNCAGYIGEIEQPKCQGDSRDNVGSQNSKAGIYQYRINQKYILTYNSTDVSASIDFENSKKEKAKQGYTLNQDKGTSR